MWKIGIGALTVLLLAGCVDPNTIEAETKPINDGKVVALAKRLVADRMRDPEATRFKNDFSAYQSASGDYIVCGTMNAKNAMGGYVGYKPFFVRIRNNAIAAFNTPDEDDQAVAVASQVRQKCAEAAAGTLMVSS